MHKTETPCLIRVHFWRVVNIYDMFTYAKFGDDLVMSFGVTWVKFSLFY